jgi:hypothetical protein
LQEPLSEKGKDFYLSLYFDIPIEVLNQLTKGALLFLRFVVNIYVNCPNEIKGAAFQTTYQYLEANFLFTRKEIRKFIRQLEKLNLLYRRHKISDDKAPSTFSIKIIRQHSNNNTRII